MPSFAPPIPDVRLAQANLFPSRFAIALGLAALADWLFYGERVGISFVLFSIALMGCSLLANHAASDGKRMLIAGLALIAGIIPAVEQLNALSLAFALLGLGLAVSIATNPDLDDGLADRARALCDFFLLGPFRLIRDMAGSLNMPALATGFVVWFIPIVLGGVFVVLFASANPLIEKWFAQLNPGNAASQVSLARLLFWLVALSAVWPFIHVRWRRRIAATAAPAEPAPDESQPSAGSSSVDFFGVATVLRSLILFNLLFAIQTILDVVYLWGNAALPADITYAAYAHRGAYPLIVTALLAAGFVLIAMKPGGPAEQSKVIRPLVYLWVAQNVMLVVSSILRLDLYVQIYLLTYWRIAAFVWMLLVAIGLVLIVARIALRRSAPMADSRQSHYPDRNAVHLFAGELRRHYRRLQCHAQPGSIGQRRFDRYALSEFAWTASNTCPRHGVSAAGRRYQPCFAPQLPCRKVAAGHDLMARMELSKLAAAAAHSGSRETAIAWLSVVIFRRSV